MLTIILGFAHFWWKILTGMSLLHLSGDDAVLNICAMALIELAIEAFILVIIRGSNNG